MEKNKYIGIGLVLGAAIGAGFGVVINIDFMPITSGIGCGLGLIGGAMMKKFQK